VVRNVRGDVATSGMGQKAKYSPRADVFRFAPESRRQGMSKAYRFTLTIPACVRVSAID
jgi:hypothetical protein